MSVKGGGGVPPKSVTFFLAKILSVKGGGVPPKSVTFFLEKILSVKGGGVPPISVNYFLDQKEVFLGQKTPFLALFEEHFSGECP